MTGYYRSPTGAPTFSATYDRTLAELRRVAPGKPILLSEVGATETGGRKLDWVKSFFPGLRANSDIVGFVWFNYSISENGATNDWRLNSTAAVFDEFRADLKLSGFGRQRGKSPFLTPLSTPPPALPTTPTTSTTAVATAVLSPTTTTTRPPTTTTTTRPPTTTTTRPPTTTTTRPPTTTTTLHAH
jgi:hypothetical protein